MPKINPSHINRTTKILATFIILVIISFLLFSKVIFQNFIDKSIKKLSIESNIKIDVTKLSSDFFFNIIAKDLKISLPETDQSILNIYELKINPNLIKTLLSGNIVLSDFILSDTNLILSDETRSILKKFPAPRDRGAKEEKKARSIKIENVQLNKLSVQLSDKYGITSRNLSIKINQENNDLKVVEIIGLVTEENYKNQQVDLFGTIVIDRAKSSSHVEITLENISLNNLIPSIQFPQRTDI